MYRALESWGCIGLCLVSFASHTVLGYHHDPFYRVHRVEKEYKALRGRDSTCQSGYSPCAASLGGDCCPDNYACAQTYCYATTAGPTSACSSSGYYNCGSDSPGACCPTNYICRADGCYLTAGAATTQSCSANYYACPASLNGGCCLSGMACGVDQCYSTSASTYNVTSAITTTNSEGSTTTSVVTSTVVITPSVTDVSAVPIPKLVQSTVSKVAAMETSSSSGGSGGLSQSQLGGIIAGVVILFLAVIIAAFVIIRRLKRTQAAVEGSKRGSSTANQTVTTAKPGYRSVSASVTEVDTNNDIDSLMRDPRHRPPHLRAISDPSVDGGRRSPARSPGLSSGHSTPPAWGTQYNAMAQADDGIRHPSMDSATGGYYNAAGNSRDAQGSSHRGSYDSQSTNPNNRHMSYTSELDSVQLMELGAAEEATGRKRSSSGATKPPTSTPHPRRSSDPHQRGRSDSSALTPLVTVNEMNELHGYYGPPDQQVGQTAARLEPGSSPTTET